MMEDADGVDGDKAGERPDEEREGRERREGTEANDGWASGGHRKKICSRCCVERGPDGDVVCLGCLPFVEG